jgi:hypothetical protein
MLFMNGCVTHIYPLENADSIAQEMNALAPQLGKPAFIGITASLKLKSLTEDPSLSIYLRHNNTEKRLKIRAEAKPKLITKDGFIPLLFVVPQGSYSLEKVEIYIPGGEVNGQSFKGSSVTVPIDKKFSGFQIEDGTFIHLMKIGAATAQKFDKNDESLQNSFQTYHSFERPAPETWDKFKRFFLPRTSYFLSRTPMDQVELLKLDWSKDPARGLPSRNGADFEAPFLGRRSESVNKVLESFYLKARECHRTRVPQKKGRINYTYVISPDGSVADAKVTENQIAGQNFADCIAAALKTLKFGPAPHDDYSLWNGYLEF